MSAPLLELEGITAGYGRTTVLRDVSLTVEAGTVDALLGPNGAGKTTLLRVIAGLLRPSSGTVRLGGEDITRLTPAERVRAGLCLVPEGRGVFPNLTVAENLRLQVIDGRSALEHIEQATSIFPALSGRLATEAGRLSGGQQQMVALSRCFSDQHRVVLLDEVSLGLAPRIVDEIFASLETLGKSGAALLLVEQYVNRALEMASVAHVIRRGQIEFRGRAAELDAEAIAESYLGT